ncbi:SusD/RagB family nutrient-binding outer membrane lipoprotein [Dysgonomonas gadei]|uniref:SusD/RagB family nutrient-binding outer membrane lipoprotein n=1 Tax=Dysgonomonas gadei TaxID=156974 RepID=UPI003AEF5D36
MKNRLTFFFIISAFLFTTSCTKDWLDINDDPNAPTTPELSQLLSGSQRYMTSALGQGNFIGNNLSSYTHHLVSREVQNYGMTTTANNIYNSWNYFYIYSLIDFDAIIKNAEPDGNLIYAGIAKTLKAYTFSMMVDLWGDVPYSEYNIPGLTAPKADKSASIYNSVIALLEEGLADLQNSTAANPLKPGDDDFFYSGNKDKWIRLNNTIKLKLLLQTRLAKSDITDWQKRLSDLITANNFIASGEDFQFWYTAKLSPDERHPTFVSEYANKGTTHYISPYFYEMMKGLTYNNTKNPFAGITDPRVPYYFYNQLKTGQAAQNNHSYREGNFLTIFFADNGSNNAGDQSSSMSKVGIYLCGGKYDDGNGGAVSANTGNGVAPLKLVTFHSLKFMLAELALTGEINGDAKALFKEGMNASIAHVNTVAAKQSNIPTIATADRDAFTTSVLAKYDAASDAGKLEIIMTQKWIGNIFSPEDAYTDYRRTGYPELFNPANTADPGYGVNPTVTALSPARVPIAPIVSFPRSLYYPTTTETDLNPNLEQKTNLSAKFIFWDK